MLNSRCVIRPKRPRGVQRIASPHLLAASVIVVSQEVSGETPSRTLRHIAVMTVIVHHSCLACREKFSALPPAFQEEEEEEEEASWGTLGASWELPGGLLEGFWGPLGASWGPLWPS